MISRSDLRNNPDTLFVFGDNMVGRGFGGQAKAMRGEPNAVGIPTKWHPTMNEEAFFSDGDWREKPHVKFAIDAALKRLRDHIAKGGMVIIPPSGIGTGLADLPRRAPIIAEYINRHLKDIAANTPGGTTP